MKQEGFTLIELLVVIAIISLLSSVLIIGLNAKEQSETNKEKCEQFKYVTLGNANDSVPQSCIDWFLDK